MTRRYDEPLHVRRRDDEPTQFLWRGRLYVVTTVLARWVETGAWWHGSSALTLLGTDAPADPPTGVPALTRMPATGASADTTTTLDDGDREVWRVEASAGRASGAGVYDLVHDWTTGTWQLARTLD